MRKTPDVRQLEIRQLEPDDLQRPSMADLARVVLAVACLMILAAGAATAQSWAQCAVEGQYCLAPSSETFTIRYGKNGTFYYAESSNTGVVPCRNTQLGDPLYNVDKHCELRPSSVPGSQAFVPCATEGTTCDPGGGENPRHVRYGTQGHWYYSIESNAFPCTNTFHDFDPLPGVVKSCEVGGPAIPEAPVSGVPWYLCAQAEGGTCQIPDPSREAFVRYGYGDQWTYRRMTGSQLFCQFGTFGTDPYPNQLKVCEVHQVPPVSGLSWQFCAQAEGGICLIPDPSLEAFVRYGYGDQWIYRRMTDSQLTCQFATFGVDPYPNQLKICEVYQEQPTLTCPAGQFLSGQYCLETWEATDLPDNTRVAIRTTRVMRDYSGGSDVWQRFYGKVGQEFDPVDATLEPRDILRVKTYSDSCCAYSYPWYRLEAHDGTFVVRAGGGDLSFGSSEAAAILFTRSKTWVGNSYFARAFALAGTYTWSERFDYTAQRNFHSICQSPFNLAIGSLENLSTAVRQWLSGPGPGFGCYPSGAHEFFIVHDAQLVGN